MDRWLLLVVISLCCLQPLQAAKVYKWTDEDGNVSYRDKPPPEGNGTVEEKEINPDINLTHTVPKAASKNSRESGAPASGMDSGGTQPYSVKTPSQRPGLGQISEGGQQSTPEPGYLAPSGTPGVTPPPTLTPPPAITPPPAPTPPPSPSLPPPPTAPPAPGGGI